MKSKRQTCCRLLRRVEAKVHETVKRLRATQAPFSDLELPWHVQTRSGSGPRGCADSRRSTPRAAITDPAGVGKLLRRHDGYDKFLIADGLKLPGFDFEAWSKFCGASGLKLILTPVFVGSGPKDENADDISPAAGETTLAILTELHKITGDNKFLFRHARADERFIPIGLNIALQGAGLCCR